MLQTGASLLLPLSSCQKIHTHMHVDPTSFSFFSLQLLFHAFLFNGNQHSNTCLTYSGNTKQQLKVIPRLYYYTASVGVTKLTREQKTTLNKESQQHTHTHHVQSQCISISTCTCGSVKTKSQKKSKSIARIVEINSGVVASARCSMWIRARWESDHEVRSAFGSAGLLHRFCKTNSCCFRVCACVLACVCA